MITCHSETRVASVTTRLYRIDPSRTRTCVTTFVMIVLNDTPTRFLSVFLQCPTSDLKARNSNLSTRQSNNCLFSAEKREKKTPPVLLCDENPTHNMCKTLKIAVAAAQYGLAESNNFLISSGSIPGPASGFGFGLACSFSQLLVIDAYRLNFMKLIGS
jgi:hypothetical protein